MSLDWVNVSVYHGRTRLHKDVDVQVIGIPTAMFVWDHAGSAATIYTGVVNIGTNRFRVVPPGATESISIQIAGPGAGGCCG